MKTLLTDSKLKPSRWKRHTCHELTGRLVSTGPERGGHELDGDVHGRLGLNNEAVWCFDILAAERGRWGRNVQRKVYVVRNTGFDQHRIIARVIDADVLARPGTCKMGTWGVKELKRQKSFIGGEASGIKKAVTNPKHRNVKRNFWVLQNLTHLPKRTCFKHNGTIDALNAYNTFSSKMEAETQETKSCYISTFSEKDTPETTPSSLSSVQAKHFSWNHGDTTFQYSFIS